MFQNAAFEELHCGCERNASKGTQFSGDLRTLFAYPSDKKVRTLRGTQKNPVGVELERLPDSWW